MAGFMREARAYPQGAVASPHYLATAAGLATLASGGNALDAALATNLVLGVVTPYLCGLRRRRARDGVGRFVARLRGRRSFAAGGDGGGRACTRRRTPEPDGRHADVRRARGDRPGRAAGLVRPARAVGEPVVRRARRGARCSTRKRASCSRGAGRRCSRVAASPTTTSDSADFGRAYPQTDPGDWIRQPALARTIRALADEGPDHYYKGEIADAIAARLAEAGSFMTCRRPRRARRRMGRAAPRRVRGSRRRRAAATHPRRHRAGGAPHRRRVRPPDRRRRTRASARRGDEVRARRPQPLRR